MRWRDVVASTVPIRTLSILGPTFLAGCAALFGSFDPAERDARDRIAQARADIPSLEPGDIDAWEVADASLVDVMHASTRYLAQYCKVPGHTETTHCAEVKGWLEEAQGAQSALLARGLGLATAAPGFTNRRGEGSWIALEERLLHMRQHEALYAAVPTQDFAGWLRAMTEVKERYWHSRVASAGGLSGLFEAEGNVVCLPLSSAEWGEETSTGLNYMYQDDTWLVVRCRFPGRGSPGFSEETVWVADVEHKGRWVPLSDPRLMWRQPGPDDRGFGTFTFSVATIADKLRVRVPNTDTYRVRVRAALGRVPGEAWDPTTENWTSFIVFLPRR